MALGRAACIQQTYTYDINKCTICWIYKPNFISNPTSIMPLQSSQNIILLTTECARSGSLESRLVLLFATTWTTMSKRELDLTVMELYDMWTSAILGLDNCSAHNLNRSWTSTMTTRHLSVCIYIQREIKKHIVKLEICFCIES